MPLQLRHYELDGISYHQFDDCLLKYLFTTLTIVYPTICSGTDQRNIKAPHHWPLCGELTGDQWIHRTKGQTMKMFPFDDVIMATEMTYDYAKSKSYSTPYI